MNTVFSSSERSTMTFLCHAVCLGGNSMSLVCTLLAANTEVGYADFPTRRTGDTVRWWGWVMLAIGSFLPRKLSHPDACSLDFFMQSEARWLKAQQGDGGKRAFQFREKCECFPYFDIPVHTWKLYFKKYRNYTLFEKWWPLLVWARLPNKLIFVPLARFRISGSAYGRRFMRAAENCMIYLKAGYSDFWSFKIKCIIK